MIGKALVATSVNTGLSDGAIVGEEAALEYHALQVNASTYLSTGTLEVGESGDAGGLAEFTAECWFMPGATISTGTRDLLRGPASSGAATQWRLQLLDTGALRAVMITNISTYTATSAAGIVAGASGLWHHLVAAVTSGSLRVYNNAVEMASVAVSGVMPAIGAGQDMRVHDSGANAAATYDEVAVYRHGLTAVRVLAHYQAGRARGFVSQFSGGRINAILDVVESTAPRSIQAGDRGILAEYMRGQDPLGSIKAAASVDTPDGLFFTARDGTLTYLESSHRSSSPYNTVQATFDDDGTDLPYVDLELDFSDSFLRNHWTITRAGRAAVTQEASDATSISRYGKRPAGAADVPLTDDTDVVAIAAAMLAKYKEPLTRITSLTLTTADPAVAEAAFRRDIGDRIRVFRTPPGGGTRIDQTLFIQKIEVSGANDGQPWTIRWAVSPV